MVNLSSLYNILCFQATRDGFNPAHVLKRKQVRRLCGPAAVMLSDAYRSTEETWEG